MRTRFGLVWIPYNQRQNGYVFEVTASNVQSELYIDDYTFDAVWQKCCTHWEVTDGVWNENSLFSYPVPAKVNKCGNSNLHGKSGGTGRHDQWTLTPKKLQNKMLYWGTLTGITNVEPPLRLVSNAVFISVYGERAPQKLQTDKPVMQILTPTRRCWSKVGLDERFNFRRYIAADF